MRGVSTRLTRLVRGLREHSEAILQDGEPFSTRHFVISQGAQGWMLEPRQTGEARSFRDALPPPLLNGEILTEPRPLEDDDRIEAGPSIWVFHAGEVARDDGYEEAALGAEPAGVPWQILSDWLQERADPLGERIARHLGTRTAQRALGRGQGLDVIADMPLPASLRTGDAWFRLEADEENGLWRRLIARSVQLTNADDVAAILHLRRSRFLEHLVLDLADDDFGAKIQAEWVARLEAWPLPRWLKTISFGAMHGPAPEAALRPPERLLDRCPRLERAPLIQWERAARVEQAGQEPVALRPGTVIERTEAGVRVHPGPPRADAGRTYAFALVHGRWRLEASDVERLDLQLTRPMVATIAGRKVRRTPLLPDDRIEIEGGPVLTFRVGQ